MSWLQLQLEADPDSAGILEQLLKTAGALSVTLVDAADQSLYEPAPGEIPLWSNMLITGLFAENSNTDSLVKQLRDAFLPHRLPSVKSEILADKNWQRAWMDNFKPMLFGKRLWICPSWCKTPDPDAVNLRLDPGLAFGTGTHPTTALCLQWLDDKALNGQILVDYGCGSGILGIAALLLGAGKVYGVDNDPQAIIASLENCANNGINSQQFEANSPAGFFQRKNSPGLTKADGVLANILAEPLISLSEYLAGLVKPGGWLLLSGILEEQAESVVAAYQPWFDVKEIVTQEGWIRIEASLSVNT